MSSVKPIYSYFFGETGEFSLPGRGWIPADFALVGIAPSPNRPQHRAWEPFGASSYKIIQEIMRAVSGSIYITNLVKSPAELGAKIPKLLFEASKATLYEELRLVRPKRVVAIGKDPAVALCPGFQNLREDHGTFFWNPELSTFVVPTYHFSAGGRDPRLWPLILRDLERFFKLPDPVAANYSLITSETGWPEFESERVILDIETTSTELDAKILMLGVRAGENNYILMDPTPQDIYKLGERLTGKRLLGHNLSFDLGLLEKSAPGWLIGRVPGVSLEDTMLLAHLLGEEILSLKHLTTFYTDLPGSRFGSPQGISPAYLAEDLRSTEAVYERLKERLSSAEPFVKKIIDRLIFPIAAIRLRGVKIDRERLEELINETEQKLKALDEELRSFSGGLLVNWNSPRQVVLFLQQAGLRLTEKTPSGQYSASEATLLELQSAFPENKALKKLLEYRAVHKLLTGFLQPYLEASSEDSRLHPKLSLTGTRTGRLSCQEPNLQQVTRTGPLKTLFVPTDPEGYIGLIDLAQAELRVAAYVSEDTKLVEALLSTDVHRTIASRVFHKPPEEVSATERKASKKVTFGILYGGTATGLSKKFQLPIEDVTKVLETFMEAFPKLASWLKKMRELSKTETEVRTLFGRTRNLAGTKELEGIAGVYRKMVNTPIQSVASDIMTTVFGAVWSHLEFREAKSRVLFGVHDSLLLDVARGEEELVAGAVQAGFLELRETPLGRVRVFEKLPITGELILGKSWAAVEDTNENYHPEMIFAVSSHQSAAVRQEITHKEAKLQQLQQKLEELREIEELEELEEPDSSEVTDVSDLG